jgi:enoyl-CoA hydratase/carnithine racemase
MSSQTTQASFPETGLGYIPDGGSIFFLSRLEGELGAFLALTGFPIVNWDLVKLGLTRSFTFPYLEESLSKSTMSRNIFGNMHEYTEKWEETFKKSQSEKNTNNFNNMHSHLSRDELKKMNLLSNNDPFTYPWERKEMNDLLNPSPTVFHSMIEKDIHSDKEVNFKDSKGRYFSDTYENFLNLVYSRIPTVDQRYFSLAHIVKDINRLFRFNTVKEIYEALKEENSYFSEMCLEYLDNKSPLALEVTLRMLRNARKMNYTEIMKQEINVAKNMIIKNKDFDLAMQSRISKYSTDENDRNNVKFGKTLSQVTEEDVDAIFEDSKILSKIKLDVKDNSLLPHNRYFEKYPDCFRLWFNENPRAHGDIRANFDYEIKHFMIEKL